MMFWKKSGAASPKQVDRQRNQQHLADEVPIADDLWNEPGNVEAGRLALYAVAGRDEDELPRPDRGEHLTRIFLDRMAGALNQGLLAANPADQEPALRAARHRRKWETCETVEIGPHSAGADAFLPLGDPQDVTGVEGIRMADAVAQLDGIDSNAMHAKKRRQGNKPGFGMIGAPILLLPDVHVFPQRPSAVVVAQPITVPLRRNTSQRESEKFSTNVPQIAAALASSGPT